MPFIIHPSAALLFTSAVIVCSDATTFAMGIFNIIGMYLPMPVALPPPPCRSATLALP